MKNVFLFIVLMMTCTCHASAIKHSSRPVISYVPSNESICDGDSTIPVFFYDYYSQFYGTTRVRFMIGEMLHFGDDTAFIRINEYAAYPFNDVLTVSNEQQMTDSSVSVPFSAKSGDRMRMYWALSVEKFSKVNGIDTSVFNDSTLWMGVKDTVVFYLDVIDSSNAVVQILDTIGIRPFDNIFEKGINYFFIQNGPIVENDTAYQKSYILSVGSNVKTARLRIRPHLGSEDGEDRFNMERESEISLYQRTFRNLQSRNMVLEEIVNTLSPCINNADKRGGVPTQKSTPKPYNISVSPMPASGLTTFTIYNPSLENVLMPKCWLMDVSGQVKRIIDVDNIISGVCTVEVDLSEWSAGSYIVYFTSDTNVLAKESFVIIH